MTLGDKIRQLRKDRGITIEALASDLDSSYSTIGMYETNNRKPNYDMLSKIANYFGVSVDYLIRIDLTGDDKEVVNKTSSIFDNLTDDEFIALKAFLDTYRKQKAISKRGE